MAKIIDGKKISQEIKDELKKAMAEQDYKIKFMSDKGLPQNAAATLQPDFLFDHMDELIRRAPEMRRLEERLRGLEAQVTDADAACVTAIPGEVAAIRQQIEAFRREFQATSEACQAVEMAESQKGRF